jgi:hypothetical protein
MMMIHDRLIKQAREVACSASALVQVWFALLLEEPPTSDRHYHFFCSDRF